MTSVVFSTGKAKYGLFRAGGRSKASLEIEEALSE